MRYYFLLLGLLLTMSSHGQVPGFLGKRFSVFLEGNPTPALFIQNINNKAIFAGEYSTKSTFAFNFRPQASFEYLVGKKISLGVSFSKLMAGTTRAYTLEAPMEDGSTHWLYDLDVMKGIAYGFHAKFYLFGKSGSVPPIGFYQTASIYYTSINTYDDKKSNVKQFEKDFTYPVIAFSTGRQTMIAKNVLLKTGVEYGWALVPINFFTSTEDSNLDEFAGHQTMGSLFGYYMFSFNVALGYTF
jgi:hypothetical protein